MSSKAGSILGLVGSILMLVYSGIMFAPIMGPPIAFRNLQYFILAIVPIITGILGLIAGSVGKAGNTIVAAVLLIVAGIGAIIRAVFFILFFEGFLPPFVLVGGILALFGGILVLASIKKK
jgi:hypothetical protein